MSSPSNPRTDVSRRSFLKSAGAVTLGFTALPSVVGCGGSQPIGDLTGDISGPLIADPDGILDLPEGFRYTSFSGVGEVMTDGFTVPGYHDGMGAFPGANGTVVLVRNHEVPTTVFGSSAFGADGALQSKLPDAKIYDLGGGRAPRGGTTTLVYDPAEQKLVRHSLSLAGTTMNCSGGVTPWGSWISCEETTVKRGDYNPKPDVVVRLDRDHGYAFEVPADPDLGVVDPVPLTALGRFVHEAAAVHARSGMVYLTEDRSDGAFYRFVPDTPGDLTAGRLQALVLRGRPGIDTSNTGDEPTIERGAPMHVAWIDLDDVDSPENDLHVRARAAGAAVFRRGEGMWAGDDEVYFDCTNGGPKELGQVWRYRPSSLEGTAAEQREPATLELFVESETRDFLTNSDNLTITPWGDLFLCEDHAYRDERRPHLIGITPEGGSYPVARNVMNSSEMAGCVFSPDGSTLFVNIQVPGITLAITGPWRGRA